MGARAIYYAAHHRRRELYVGLPTVEAIISNKIVPGFLDRYLARNGYDAQQTSEPENPDRPDNLWQPVPGDHGAHGVFGDRAKPRSPQLWMDLRPAWLGFGALLLTGAGFALAKLRS